MLAGQAPELLAHTGQARYALVDGSYDADPLRGLRLEGGDVPVIPGRSSREDPFGYERRGFKAYLFAEEFAAGWNGWSAKTGQSTS
jgi:hypothetical protein